MVHYRWQNKLRQYGGGIDGRDPAIGVFQRPGGSSPERHALAHYQHPITHSEYQYSKHYPNSGGATDRPEYRGPGGYRKRRTINIRSACTAAERDSGECSGQAANSTGGGSGRGSGKNRNSGSRGNTLQTALNQRTIANEVVAEIDGSLSDAQADQLARRHGPRASAITEFSAHRQHHRFVPRYQPPRGRYREPRTRHRGQRSLGAAELPVCAAGAEGGIDRGRSRAICGCETSIAPGAYVGPRYQRHHCP